MALGFSLVEALALASLVRSMLNRSATPIIGGTTVSDSGFDPTSGNGSLEVGNPRLFVAFSLTHATHAKEAGVEKCDNANIRLTIIRMRSLRLLMTHYH